MLPAPSVVRYRWGTGSGDRALGVLTMRSVFYLLLFLFVAPVLVLRCDGGDDGDGWAAGND